MPKEIRNGLVVLLISTMLIIISYFFIDKPVAFWVHQQAFRHWDILEWCGYSMPILIGLAPLCFLLLIVRSAYHKTNYFDFVIFVFFISIVVGMFLKDILKPVFGRFRPETWSNNLPSLIGNNSYGFNFFHTGLGFRSFPSGHTTVITAAMIALWLTYPRFRWLYALLIFLMVVCLIGRNYHFVGDVIAGGTLGGLTAYYVVAITKALQKKNNIMEKSC